MKTYKYGFTMIELLVVIAIIVILSGLMLPAISKMQEKGRIATCVNNLKQLHVAAVSFAVDHDGRLPFAASEEVLSSVSGFVNRSFNHGWVEWYPDWSDSNPPIPNQRLTYWWNQDNWMGVASVTKGTLFNYLGDSGDEAVYVCPTMSRVARKQFTSSTDRGNQKHIVARSYGMNASLSDVLYYSVEGATRTILFADQGFQQLRPAYSFGLENTFVHTVPIYYPNSLSNSRWNDPLLEDVSGTQRICRHFDGCIDWNRGTDNTVEHIGEYHNGRGNVVFADGHVERIEYDYTRYICSGAWEAGKPPDGVTINP